MQTKHKPKTKPPVPSCANSMKQAAQLWKIPMPILRAAAAAGCGAFRNHRVYRSDLTAWLQNHPEVFQQVAETASNRDRMQALRCQKLQLQTQALEFQLEIAKGLMIPKTEAEETWSSCVAVVTEEAKSALDREQYRLFIERIKTRISAIIASATPTATA